MTRPGIRAGPAPLTARERLAQPSASDAMPGAAPAKPHRKRRVRRVLGRALGMLSAVILLGAAGGGIAAWQLYERFSADLPSLDTLQHYDPKVVSRIYAGDSQLMAEYGTERRIFVPIAAIPKQVQQAFISAEDHTFWTHHGVDPAAILRAGLHDFEQWGSGRRPQGASTITQQLAKNMLVGNQLSLARKAKEAILAIRIDQALSKERVLELYLNEIYLGQGSYGVAAAAQAYFNKPLDQLTLAEAALLGAMPKAPNANNPFRFPDAARARRDFVLDRMREDGAITAEQAQEAKAQPVVPAGGYREPETVSSGKWFAEEVRRLLVQRYGSDAVNTGGLTVRTSLDPALQEAADRALRAGLMRYDRQHGGWRGPVTQITAAATSRTPGPPSSPPWPGRRACCRSGGSASCSTWARPRHGSGGSTRGPGSPAPRQRRAPVRSSSATWAGRGPFTKAISARRRAGWQTWCA